MMNCQEVLDDLSAYLDQELPQEKMLEIQKHLGKCPACKEELAVLEKTVLMLSSLPVLGAS
jgi:anti-sigma factor RsiW